MKLCSFITITIFLGGLLATESQANDSIKKFTTDKESSYTATEVNFPGGASIIHPGERVLLKLPWIGQTPGEGICVAASAINILQSLDPKLKMTQDELYETMTNGIKRMDSTTRANQTGANSYELALAVDILGYKISKAFGPPFESHLDEIKSELDSGHPIEVFATGLSMWDDDPQSKGSGHAFTLIGYRQDSLIFWDQASMYGLSSNPFSIKTDEVGNVICAMYFIDKKDADVKAVSQASGDLAGGAPGSAVDSSSPQGTTAPIDPETKAAQDKTGLQLKRYQVSLKGRDTVDQNYDLRLAKVCTTLLNNREYPVLYKPTKYAVLLWAKPELGWFRARVFEGDADPTEVNIKGEDLKDWTLRETHDDVDDAIFFGTTDFKP